MPYTLGRPNRNGNPSTVELTIHRTIWTHNPMSFDSMPKGTRDLTTIQLTTDTRDRLYRLKFRKTYDEFLQELCDLYDESDPKGRK